MAQKDARAKVRYVHDSILNRPIDAIVNSAHPSLLHGSGISGVIHRAAGIELEKACRLHGPQKVCGVVITPGFYLPHRHIIHVVTPKIGWAAKGQEEEMWGKLELAYRNVLCMAEAHGIETVAIPVLGIGKNGFEVERALRVARNTIVETLAVLSVVKHVELVSPHHQIVTALLAID